MEPLFKTDKNIFLWTDVETFLIKSQYNEMLLTVNNEYEVQYPSNKPNKPSFLNKFNCLTLEPCHATEGLVRTFQEKNKVIDSIKLFADANKQFNVAVTKRDEAQTNYQQSLDSYNNLVGGTKQTKVDENALKAAEIALTERKKALDLAEKEVQGAIFYNCVDFSFIYWLFLPDFHYIRKQSVPTIPTPPLGEQPVNFNFDTRGLTVGAVLWLYFYERMGIFKILGALLDDYNYRGKYTISGRRKDSKEQPVNYSFLMDMICTLHRAGISSNLRDRICLYQRVLGVTIENNLGIESERNSGFMNTFNRLIDYMLEYYKAKQLAQAIQSQSALTQPRSSVATQTSIRDNIKILQQHFEPLQYGRNQINTFLGIATVHATLCLVNMLKAEIGIPTQYEKPEEFIPAAYDILVAKRSPAVNEANRFILYDNCASYGYRLLTDIETIDLELIPALSLGSNLDTWLNDIEGIVEGYRNAYSAVPEKVGAIV